MEFWCSSCLGTASAILAIGYSLSRLLLATFTTMQLHSFVLLFNHLSHLRTIVFNKDTYIYIHTQLKHLQAVIKIYSLVFFLNAGIERYVSKFNNISQFNHVGQQTCWTTINGFLSALIKRIWLKDLVVGYY